MLFDGAWNPVNCYELLKVGRALIPGAHRYLSGNELGAFMPNVFEDQNLPSCPRCDEPVVMVIQTLNKPTKYVHARNNQDNLIHEDLTIDGEYNG